MIGPVNRTEIMRSDLRSKLVFTVFDVIFAVINHMILLINHMTLLINHMTLLINHMILLINHMILALPINSTFLKMCCLIFERFLILCSI